MNRWKIAFLSLIIANITAGIYLIFSDSIIKSALLTALPIF